MPRVAWRPWLLVAGLALVAGCAENSMALQGRVAKVEQDRANLSKQNELFQARIAALDKSNQEQETLLAQTRQQSKVLEDQLALTREQLRTTTAQLSQTQVEKQDVDNRARALTASVRRQTGVSIAPNNSFLQSLPVIHLPEVHVRRDGDVIRVELPGNQMFDTGSARLRPEAARLIADAAAEIHRNYPDQILGVEGHTDSDPISGGQFRSNRELASARANAVADMIVGSNLYRTEQVFVVGHGSNHPVVSNATLEGKQRNRRVELVIYPEKRR